MLLNQIDVAVYEDLENVIIPIDSSTEGTMSWAKEYSSGETTVASSAIGVSTACVNAYGSEC